MPRWPDRFVRDFPAARIVSHVKSDAGTFDATASTAMELAAAKAEDMIKAHPDLPYETGALQRGVAVDFIGGKNPRMRVSMPGHGLFHNDGTSTLPARGFVEDVMKSQRRTWELEARDFEDEQRERDARHRRRRR